MGAAVVAFKRDWHLVPDDPVIGPKTIAALDKEMVAFERPEGAGQHLLRNAADRAADLVEAQRAVMEGDDDGQRPAIADPREQPADPHAIAMRQDGGGHIHVTRPQKYAFLAGSADLPS